MPSYKPGDVLGALGGSAPTANELFARAAPGPAVVKQRLPQQRGAEPAKKAKRKRDDETAPREAPQGKKLTRKKQQQQQEQLQQAAAKKKEMVVATAAVVAQRRAKPTTTTGDGGKKEAAAAAVVVPKTVEKTTEKKRKKRAEDAPVDAREAAEEEEEEEEEEELGSDDEDGKAEVVVSPAKKEAPVVVLDAAAEAEKYSRTVFVGNLPKSVAKKRLVKFFTPYGTVESARLRSVPTVGVKVDDAGNQKLVKKVSAMQAKLSDAKATTNAYVVFKDVAAVEKAVSTANGATFTVGEVTTHIRVDKAVATRAPDEHLRTAFCGNLPRTVSEEGLRTFFATHLAGGDDEIDAAVHRLIANVRVVRDPETHASKGIAYVLLTDRAHLAAALELDGTDYSEANSKKRPMRVSTCGKRAPVKKNKGGAGKNKVVAPGKRHNAMRRLDAKTSGNDGEPKAKKPRHRDLPGAAEKPQKDTKAPDKNKAAAAAAGPGNKPALPGKKTSGAADKKKLRRGGKAKKKGPSKAPSASAAPSFMGRQAANPAK